MLNIPVIDKMMVNHFRRNYTKKQLAERLVKEINKSEEWERKYYEQFYYFKPCEKTDLNVQLKTLFDTEPIAILGDMSIKPLNKWIPVSERLPETNNPIIATISISSQNKTFVNVTQFNTEWLDGDWRIIAWMPLPEPYTDEHGSPT